MGIGRRGASGTGVVLGLAIALAIAGIVAADLDLGDGDYGDGDTNGQTSADATFTSPDSAFASAIDVNSTANGKTAVFESENRATVFVRNDSSGEWEEDRVFEVFSEVEPDETLPHWGSPSYQGAAVAMNHDDNGVLQADNVVAFRSEESDGLGGNFSIWRRETSRETEDPGDWVEAWHKEHPWGHTIGSVALSDEAVAVGFPQAGDDNSGAVYIARLNTDQEVIEDEDWWIAEDSGDSDALGIDVAAEENMVLMGDPTGTWDGREDQTLADSDANSKDKGYALAFDVTTGTLVSVIDPAGSTGSSQFGQAVDLSGTKETTALIGAPAWQHDPDDTFHQGRAWRCTGIDSTDLACSEVVADQVGGNDVNEPGAYGASVEIWDGSMAIGSPADRNGKPAKQSGAIFIYEDGQQVQERTQPDDWENEDEDTFGAGVAWNGYALWGGNPAEDGGGGVGFFWN